jgi:uncharacterized delta-60 repeat protein
MHTANHGCIWRLKAAFHLPGNFQVVLRRAILIALIGVLTGGGALARPAQPGSVDTGFAPSLDSNAVVYAVALQTNGQILLGGSFVSVGGMGITNLARLNPDGSLDASFNPARAVDKGYVDAIAIQADGKILVGGFFASSGFTAPANLCRLNTNGTVDNLFDPGLYVDSAVNSVVPLRGGGILFGGAFANVDGYVRRNIAELLPNGSLDTSFDACVASTAGAGATGLAVQSDDRILASGEFGFNSGAYRNGIARLSSCGVLDTNYASVPGVNPGGTAFTLALPSSGLAFLGGNFFNYNGTNSIGIIQLDSGGNVFTGFSPVNGITLGGTNFTIALQPDGKIIIGGEFEDYNGTTRYRIARIQANGALDPQFDPGTGPNNTVSAIAIQPDGKIIVTGKFTSFNSLPRIGIARLYGDQAPSVLSQPAVLGNGQFRLTFAGNNQVHYSLQASSNLNSWVGITNFTGTTNPIYLFDPSAASFKHRFYRAVSLP